MSTRIRLYCKTCQSQETIDECYDYEKANFHAIIRHVKLIIALKPFLEDCDNARLTYRDRYLPIYWLETHQDHDLTIIDEYGRLDGQCGERVRCSHCTHTSKCRLPMGHEGEHDSDIADRELSR